MGRGGIWWAVAVLVLSSISGVASAGEPVDCDILLKGGRICDGTLAEPKVGHVAIRGDRIVGVGEFTPGRVGIEIDCTGLVIAPPNEPETYVHRIGRTGRAGATASCSRA